MKKLLAGAIVASVIATPLLASSAEAATSRIQLTTHGVVARSSLLHCTVEDASNGPVPCSWNFDHTDGNGRGLAYWVSTDDHTHYVWARTPATNGWHWVSQELGDALAEGGSTRAPERKWERCVVRRQTVKCADGHRERW